MKSDHFRPFIGGLLMAALCFLPVAGCQDPGNEPVKDGKTVTSDREAMQKMYRNTRSGQGTVTPQ
ncbi:MAG: hypothetical protein SFU56_16315 [Capsulimonadales bacterium]|nr:hypothetical protein [Capsulimonadales bacterium]